MKIIFIKKPNKFFENFDKANDMILEELAFDSINMKYEDGIIKMEPIFKEQSIELQKQAVQYKAEEEIKELYPRAIEKISKKFF